MPYFTICSWNDPWWLDPYLTFHLSLHVYSKNLVNVDSVDQPAVCSITWIGVSHCFAADVLAPRVLWAVNVEVSMPAAANVHFIQREIVSLLTGLCGDYSPKNNFVEHRFSLRELVFHKYSFRMVVAHKFPLFGKAWSLIGAKWVPQRVCFKTVFTKKMYICDPLPRKVHKVAGCNRPYRRESTCWPIFVDSEFFPFLHSVAIVLSYTSVLKHISTRKIVKFMI